MSDLTIIYLTANEMPDLWMEFQLGHLMQAARGFQIISISRRPMDLGENLIDTQPKSYWNLYMQLLRGARMANTPYVAVAEDDVLYTREHFTEFRPPRNAVSYDRARWSLFSWERRPMYCLRQRISNCSLIAPRGYLVDALEERAKKYPHGNDYVGEVGRRIVDRRLGVTERNMIEWYCTSPIVQLNHVSGTDDTQRRKWKKHGQVKAWDIPHWGRASDIVRVYDGNG